MTADAAASTRAGPARRETTAATVRRVALAIAVVAVVGADVRLIGPYVGQAASALRHPGVWWVATAAAAEVASLLATALLRRRMLVASGAAVPLRALVGLTYVDYAMSVSLPAGAVVSAGYTLRRLRRLGVTTPAAGFTLLSTGVLSSVAYGVLAVAAFTVAGGSTRGPAAVVVGLVAGVALLWATRALMHRPEVLERIGRLVLRATNRILRREPDVGAAGLRSAIDLLGAIRPRGRDWAIGMTVALCTWFTDLACLVASCHAVPVGHATSSVMLMAYLAGTSVSGLSLVPGGLGVADAAVVVVLVGGGAEPAAAAAAAILYRIFSFVLPVVAGWMTWYGQRRSLKQRRRARAGRRTRHVGYPS